MKKPELAAVYAEIKRIDEIAEAENRRIDGLLKAQETAVNAALAAAEKAVAAALAASEKAVNKAESAQGNVNLTQNEFRGQLRDQASLFMPRTETELMMRELRVQSSTSMPRVETENLIRELRELIAANASSRSVAVEDLRKAVDTIRSRIDVGPTELHNLQTIADTNAGRRFSTTQGWDYALRVGAIAVGVAGFLFGIYKAFGG